VRRQRLPLVAGGTAIWSFIHIEDAARATLAAIESDRPGIYNIVDDVLAPVAEWLPALAAALGAKPPAANSGLARALGDRAARPGDDDQLRGASRMWRARR
jgi:nucleoside-diphosphate-sugar epimerase